MPRESAKWVATENRLAIPDPAKSRWLLFILPSVFDSGFRDSQYSRRCAADKAEYVALMFDEHRRYARDDDPEVIGEMIDEVIEKVVER